MTKIKNIAALFLALYCALSYAADPAGQPTVPDYTVNKDYRVIESPQDSTSVKEISEFFSFWCSHCKTFNPQMQDIAAKLDGTVAVKLYPVNFGDEMTRMAQTGYFYADKYHKGQQYLDIMFSIIHDARVDIKKPEQIASVINLIELDEKDFLRHCRDAEFTEKSALVEQLIARYDINAVPELVVNSKYIPQLFNHESVEDKANLLRYLSALP